jgi:hypothetical protein
MVPMKFLHSICRYVLILILLFSFTGVKGQDDELDRLLNEEVENINPVYKPVVGFGIGVLNYLGYQNNYYSPPSGPWQVNVSTYPTTITL